MYNTLTLAQYAEIVLMRTTDMTGLLDTPTLSAEGILSGHCCHDDERPFYYEINTQTAQLITIYDTQRVERKTA